jgi:NAD(P)-dependent dehydrogenase (short-subunit alcohol dehydrogenase family)
MNRTRYYKDAVAIITGGASGIGKALGEELAALGAHVILADIRLEPALMAAEKIKSKGGRAEAAPVDVSDFNSVERLVQETYGKHDRIDFIFNNAGIGACGHMHEFKLEHWRNVINVDLFGIIHGVQAAYPLMREQGFGHIVNTASIGGLVPFTLTGSYTASKFGVVGLTIALRMEAMGSGVCASVICPGVIRTPMLMADDPNNVILFDVATDKYEEAWRRTRPADPNQFAKKVLKQVRRNKPIIVVPGWWKILWLVFRIAPNFTINFMKKNFHDVALKDLERFRKAD